MFTQCFKCETIFRLSPGALRAAGGQVRCGRCGEVFNALSRLAEDTTGFIRGESSLELESRADEILQSAEAVAPVETTPSDIAQTALHIAPLYEPPQPQVPLGAALENQPPASFQAAEIADASLEFSLPPGELDRIFIETTPSVLQMLATESHRTMIGGGAAHPSPPTQSPPTSPLDAAGSAAPQPKPPLSVLLPVVLPPALPTTASDRVVAVISAPPARSAGAKLPGPLRREMPQTFSRKEMPEIVPPRRRVPTVVWVSGVAVLLAILGAQVLQTNSDWLAANTSLLGPSGPKPTMYQLKQWGVTGDTGVQGTLRVSAGIVNTAPQPEPYPLLRVTLADRFGTRVGRREFSAAEYLGKTPPSMLAAGARAEAVMDILDPGKDAEGFEIEICIRTSTQRLDCAADAAPQAGASQANAPPSAPQAK